MYPIVGMYSTENSFCVYLKSSELFPAPLSPNVSNRTIAGFKGIVGRRSKKQELHIQD